MRQDVSDSGHVIEMGGAIHKTLLTMREFLNPEDRGNKFHSFLEPGSQSSSAFSQSAMFGTQIPNRIPEPRKEKNAVPGAKHLLSILQQNHRSAVRITNTNPQPDEPENSPASANITRLAQPLSPKSNPATTRLEGDHEMGNIEDAQMPPPPLDRSIQDRQEVMSARILEHRKANADNTTMKAIEASTANKYQVGQIEEIYSFQENNTTIVPRNYQVVLEEQASALKQDKSWLPSSGGHEFTPPTAWQAIKAFHDKRLAAKSSANGNSLAQSSEVWTLVPNEETAETQGDEEGEDNHHNNDAPKDSYKDAEEVESTHELPHSQILYNDDDDHQSDSETSDTSELSCPSPEANSRPRRVIGENDISDQTLDQDADHMMSQSDNEMSDASAELSCPSPEANSRPRRVIRENDDSNLTLDQDQDLLISQSISPIETSEALTKCISPSSPTSITSKETPAIKFRKPTSPNQSQASSSSDDEGMDLDIPHVLGEAIQSSNSHVIEQSQISKPDLPAIIRHKSVVQVEETPKQRRHPNKELYSDNFVPGTYNSSPNKPDEGNPSSTQSKAYSLPPPPRLTLDHSESLDETSQNNYEQNNPALQQPHNESTPLRSNDNIARNNISRTQPCSPIQIPPFDGSSDVAPSTGRSLRFPSPIRQNSSEQERNDGRSTKRLRITDPEGLGFSQEESPPTDRNEMIRANRRKIRKALESLPIEDSVMFGNNIENAQRSPSPEISFTNTQSPASPENSQIIHDRIEKDLLCPVTTEQISTSQYNIPPHEPAFDLVVSNNRDMAKKSIPPNETESNLRQAHQSNQQPTSLFEKYCETYPRYTGKKRQFLQALVYLEWLGTPTKQPHRSLWDDFVRFFAHDYLELRRNKATKKSGFQEYSDLGVSDPEFTHSNDVASRIITPESLKAALSPESPDHDEIEEMRGRFQGAPGSQRSMVSMSSKTEPSRQRSNEIITITNPNDTFMPNASTQLQNTTPQRPLETVGQSSSLPNPKFTPARQEQRQGLSKRSLPWIAVSGASLSPRTETPPSHPRTSKMVEIVAAATVASKEPKKPAPGRFFETPSQLPLSSGLASLPRNSFSSPQNPTSSINSFKTPNGSPSIQTKPIELANPIRKEALQIAGQKKSTSERKPQERSLKPSLERSISPSPPRRKSSVASNKPEMVESWLKNQQSPMRVEKSKSKSKPTDFSSTAPIFKGKWEFGKYLAQKRRESSNRAPRSTPRTSF